MGAAAVLLAQAALIAGLLVQRARRRQTEVTLRASQGELYVTYAQLLDAEEEERFRIARELHDNIGQRMAALTMELDAVARGGPADDDRLAHRDPALADRARELAKDIQSISRNLHSSKLDYMDLSLALRASAGNCPGSISSRSTSAPATFRMTYRRTWRSVFFVSYRRR